MSEPIKFKRAIGNIQFSPDENRLYFIGTETIQFPIVALILDQEEALRGCDDVPAQDISIDHKHGKIVIKQNNFNLNIVDLRNNKKAITLPRQEVAMGKLNLPHMGKDLP